MCALFHGFEIRRGVRKLERTLQFALIKHFLIKFASQSSGVRLRLFHSSHCRSVAGAALKNKFITFKFQIAARIELKISNNSIPLFAGLVVSGRAARRRSRSRSKSKLDYADCARHLISHRVSVCAPYRRSDGDGFCILKLSN